MRILNSPRPDYTELARHNGIEGIVVIQALFKADGKITDIRVVRGLGFGLDEQAVKAGTKKESSSSSKVSGEKKAPSAKGSSKTASKASAKAVSSAKSIGKAARSEPDRSPRRPDAFQLRVP